MQGRVNQRCEATLALAVKGSEITQMVDTVIDTGFSGFLTSWTRCSSTTEV
jgi:predicted aspartyl protease